MKIVLPSKSRWTGRRAFIPVLLAWCLAIQTEAAYSGDAGVDSPNLTMDLKPVDVPEGLKTWIVNRDLSSGISLDLGGRKLLARSSKNKKKRGVFFDRNFDGKIDKQDGGSCGPQKPLSVEIPYLDRTIPYKVCVLGEAAYCSGTSLYGCLDGVEVYLLDSNVNGVFGEEGVDAIYVGKKNTTIYRPDDKDRAIPCVGMISFNGQLMDYSVERDQIVLTKYKGKTATISLNPPADWAIGPSKRNFTTVVLRHEETGYICPLTTDHSGKSWRACGTLPGPHTIVKNRLYRNSEDGWRSMRGYGGTSVEVKPVEVKPGDTAYSVGLPLQIHFDAEVLPDGGVSIKKAWLTGSAFGEWYRLRPGGSERLSSVLVRGEKALDTAALTFT